MQNILITGGTGFIGSRLSKKLAESGNQVTIFTRDVNELKSGMPTSFRFIKWDYRYPDEWRDELNRHDVIIHLAGVNIFGRRWDEDYKQKIIDSRETSTRNIVKAINKTDSNIKLLITASGIGYYGATDGIGVTEASPAGEDFLAEVCKKWEEPTKAVEEKGVRQVNMRTGLVLSTEEGYLNRLIPAYNFFVGGPLGTSVNYLSWIHIDDLINAYLFVINNKEISGPVNVSSPNPVTSREFASVLGSIMKRPSFFTVPKFALNLLVGEGAYYVSYSQKVFPEKLEKCGFLFRYPELKTALKDLIESGK